MQIKFTSINVNGFNKSDNKLAHFITHNNIHFTCIQETHTIHHQTLSHFAHQHCFLVFPNTDLSLTPQISQRQGTLVILNTNQTHLNTQTISPHIILPNYIQSLSFTLSENNYTLINCYLPSGKTSSQTSHRIKAIKTFSSYLHNLDFKNRRLIIAGDFNLVLHKIDKTGHFTPNTNDKILFQTILSNFDLIGSYRFLYPHSKTFSFSRLQPISRLDRIYISSPLISKISLSSYCNISFSDHNKASHLTLKIPSKLKYKSSHWKLNNSILDSPFILLYIKLFIKNLSYPLNPIQYPLKWWDLFKTKIKYKLIFYSKTQQYKISKALNTMQNVLNKAKLTHQHEEISLLKHKLKQFQEYKSYGAQIRSRLHPLSRIDDPSPLAPVIENLTQAKSLLPTDSNIPPPTSSAEKLNLNNFNSFLSFFENLWKPSSSLLNSSIYLENINSSISHEVLQTLPSSPLITYNEIRLAIQTLN